VRPVERWTEEGRRIPAGWLRAAEPGDLSVPMGWDGVAAGSDEDGNLLVAAWDAAGSLALQGWSAADELWQERRELEFDGITEVSVAPGLANLAVVEGSGQLRVFATEGLFEYAVEGVGGAVATARFLIGGGSLVAASDGAIQILLEVPMVAVDNRADGRRRVGSLVLDPGQSAVIPDNDVSYRFGTRQGLTVERVEPRWRAVRQLPAMPARPTVIAPSHRGRGFAVGDAGGSVGLYHATSGRRLALGNGHDDAVGALALAPRGNGIVAAAGGQVVARGVVNHHPEISLRTLFLPVWYEGYAAPRHVWQTTGGSDASEGKFGIWPLLFGTLKATLYAMALSIPLALGAAIYVSQLAPAWLQALVKPAVELMAAVPSVVVGFLAALWLAPLLQVWLFQTIVGLGSVPLGVVLALAIWKALPVAARRRTPRGAELALVMAGCVLVVAAALLLAGPLEAWLFGGDFERHLFTEWGVRYDQRNSLIIGVALGFAVIPVIFTIAEDACSGVPRSLVQAARALGATRWQAAIRLVVPVASPGLFAAVMLGMGRAVGETMIVLMAAGNTPILDLSPFNGMRTMSAAIAFEIPEAGVGSTLFRVLFLVGLLLFGFSLAFNMAAELVGRRLRGRYGRL
jgi:ABC-type uncharacterized transport system permease subunit